MCLIPPILLAQSKSVHRNTLVCPHGRIHKKITINARSPLYYLLHSLPLTRLATMSIASSHNSPIIDHRDRVADVMDDPFNTDADMVYFTTSADKEVMSPVLDSMDPPRHGGHDLGKMVEAYERQFHLNHTHHSMSLSLTPAITSFDLMDQNEKWHEISSRTREVRFFTILNIL